MNYHLEIHTWWRFCIHGNNLWNSTGSWIHRNWLVWSNLLCKQNSWCKIWKIYDIIKQLGHLNIQQKADIKQVLSEFTKLFDGTLGVHPHQKFHIDLETNARPTHVRPYPVPVIHVVAFVKELKHPCTIGILSPHGASEWASPTFIIPKKMAELLG